MLYDRIFFRPIKPAKELFILNTIDVSSSDWCPADFCVLSQMIY